MSFVTPGAFTAISGKSTASKNSVNADTPIITHGIGLILKRLKSIEEEIKELKSTIKQEKTK
jgi:uncharacterized protein (UPF0276 family)